MIKVNLKSSAHIGCKTEISPANFSQQRISLNGGEVLGAICYADNHPVRRIIIMFGEIFLVKLGDISILSLGKEEMR